MNHLLRELAPISDAAWAEIDAEAKRTLTHFLAARKLVDFKGPLGAEASAISLGRLEAIDGPGNGVVASHRQVLALTELRLPFILDRTELEAIDRGACDPNLDAVRDASRSLALTEDGIVFDGYAAAGIGGLAASSTHSPITLSDDFEQYPNHVAKAVAALKNSGIGGPYAIALGPRCYAGVVETTEKGGYPLLHHLGLILGGPVVWAPAVDGAVVLSQRGGDFELTVGEDISIAYRSHDADTVTLDLRESLTFLACTPEAAIALEYAD